MSIADITPEKARALWAAALRSEKYEQVTGALREGEKGRCCLGVACDVFADFHPEGVWKTDEGYGDTFTFDPGPRFKEADGLLPPRVRDWLGLTSDSGIADTDPRGHLNNKVDELSALNDDEALDFDQIADLIEAGLVRVKGTP